MPRLHRLGLDGIQLVTTRVAVALLAAMTLASCGDSGAPSPDGAPPASGAEAPALPIAEALAALDPTDAAVITEFAGSVPDAIPDRAVAWAAFVAGQYQEPPSAPEELVVATVRPTPLQIEVLCAGPGGQVPCAADADYWTITVDDPAGAVVDIGGGDAAPGAVLLTLSGDEDRPQLASRGFWTADPQPIAGGDGTDLAREPVLGGCGVAAIVDDLEPRETFSPLTSAATTRDLHLVVSVCPDTANTAILPLLAVDGGRLAGLRPITVEPGTTYAYPLADLDGASRVQGFVLVDGDREALVTWPVRIGG